MARERVPGKGSFERIDVSPRGVVIAGLAMAVTVAVFSVISVLLTGWLEPERPGPPPITGHLQRAGPPLNVEPEDTLADVRRRHRALLEGYAWIDRESGIARIPIDTAMDLLAERGWQEPPPDTPPEVRLPVPPRRVPLDDRATGPQIQEDAPR